MASDLAEFSSKTMWTATERAALLRREIGRDIVSAAHLRGDFLMSSGEHSNFYFDPHLFLGRPTILRRLAEMLAERVPCGVNRLAATTTGGIALVSAVSLVSGVPFVIIPIAITSAAGGETPSVKGELHADERVLLVEDVVDTGAHAIASARRVEEVGGHIATVLSVIDRQNGGERSLSAAEYRYDPLFRLSELDI